MKQNRMFSLMLAGVFMFSLSGCGQQSNTQEAGQTIRQSSVEETTQAAEKQQEMAEQPVTDASGLSFPIGQKIESPSFTGDAYISSMITPDDTYHFPATNHVTFAPGARSSWHSHGGMVILVTGGAGYYQEEGKPAQIIRKGDVVNIPEGVRHWHGATPDSWFSQMVIFDSTYAPSEGEAPEETAVTDEEYANLDTEEYTGRTVTEDNAFMFQRAEEAVNYETFSGPAYVSGIIDEDNAAGAPGLHYVVFDPGVINNWHSHEGGQILIATDGVGYHQIEGEPVQIMHPGDAAFCPPGVKHWHGGSTDTSFAHIAVNTNPDKSGVEWFDRISDEEYAQLGSKDEKALVAYFAYSENMGDTSNMDVDAITSASLNRKTDNTEGNLQVMARVIEEETGADIFHILMEQPYDPDYSTMLPTAIEQMENEEWPALQSKVENLDDYDVIYLGTPVWNAELPPAMHTFFAENDLSGKTIIPFGIHLGSGFGKMISEMKELAPQATVEDGFTLNASTENKEAEAEFQEWLADRK